MIGSSFPAAEKKHVLVIGDSMSLAHVARAIVVARKLQDEGHRVTFATGKYHVRQVRAEGFEPEEIHCVPPGKALAAIRSGGHIFNAATVREYVASDLELIERVGPDLIIADMRMTLNISAEWLGVEYHNILSGYFTRYFSAPENPPETFPLFRMLGPRLSRMVFPRLKPIVLRQFASGFNQVRRTLGMSPVRDVLNVMESPHGNFIADLPEYTPVSSLPANFRFIGPLIWEPSSKPPGWIDEIDPGKRTVYVTLGSTGDERKLPRVVAALMAEGYQVLVTTGGSNVQLPVGTFCTDFAPASLLLSKCQAAICHGGALTVYQAVSHGVPVVGMPTFHDQETNMDRVTALGWGVEVPAHKWSDRQLLDAVGLAVDGELQESVERGQELIRMSVSAFQSRPLLKHQKKEECLEGTPLEDTLSRQQFELAGQFS